MPQVYQAQVINQPNRTTLLGGLIGGVARPLFEMAGQQLGELISGPSRDDQIKDFTLQQMKDKQAQDLTAKHDAGQISDEAYNKYLAENGRSIGDATNTPSLDDAMRAQTASNAAKGVGFNPLTKQWDTPDLAPLQQPVPINPQDTNDLSVKAGYPGDYNPALAGTPGYNEAFVAPTGAKFNLSKLSPEQQTRARVLAQRGMSWQKTMQLYDNAQAAATPEAMQALQAGFATNEKDIAEMVDYYNDTHSPGDINHIKGMGLYNLALASRELDFRTSPNFIATLKTPQQQEANTKEIQKLQSKFQLLNSFQMDRVKESAKNINEKNVELYLNNSQKQAEVAAKVYDTNMDYAAASRKNQIDTMRLISDMTQRNFTNEMDKQRFSLEVAKYETDTTKWAQQIGLDKNKNAIELLKALQADRNSELDRRMQAATSMLSAGAKIDAAQLKAMGQASNLLSTIKGLQGYPQLSLALRFNPDEKIRQRGAVVDEAVSQQLAQAATIGTQGSTVENMLQGPLKFLTGVPGFPSTEGLDPRQARDARGNFVKSWLSTTADDIIKSTLNAGMEVPSEILNLRYNLTLNSNGTFGLTNDYIKFSSDTVLINGEKQASREEWLSKGVQQLVRDTKGKLKSYEEFLNVEPYADGRKFRDISEFKNPNIAKKFWKVYQNLSQELK